MRMSVCSVAAPAGRRRTSLEGGNRGMLRRGLASLNGYGDWKMRGRAGVAIRPGH